MSQTTAQPQEIKLFQKWTFQEITVKDIKSAGVAKRNEIERVAQSGR